jgi:hypothetical protein
MIDFLNNQWVIGIISFIVGFITGHRAANSDIE